MSPPDPEDRGGREDERRKRPEVRQRLVMMINSDNIVFRFSITSQERSLAGGQAPRTPGGQGAQTQV